MQLVPYLPISGYWYEEPCEVRVSSTVLWERRGEIPLRDPIGGNQKLIVGFLGKLMTVVHI